MKKLLLILPFLCLLCSCEPNEPKSEPEKGAEKGAEETITINFEDVSIPEKGYMDAELNGTFTAGGATFYSKWMTDFGGYSDGGIYPSKLNDKTTPGFLNQYSAMPTTTGNFAVVHYSEYNAQLGANYAYFTLPSETSVKSIDVAISTYAYWAIKAGDDGIGVCREYADGDWYKITFTAYDMSGNQLGFVDHYLADFRDGKSYISTSWETVNLTSLGDKVYKIQMSVDGTDRGEWGINTPTYCCIDNIKHKK